jgi:GNAT superfamily N-acetyltransferase
MPSATGLPNGMALRRLGDVPGAEHAAARTFCLGVIKEFYGFDYRPDWHGDLDSLEKPASQNHFSSFNNGAFWTVIGADGRIAATTGIKRLTWHPNVLEALPGRYPQPEKVATLMRAYVRKDLRGGGIGRMLNTLCEDEARRSGYATMYLHASSDTAATITFWTRNGYTPIGTFGFSTHFDKPLGST